MMRKQALAAVLVAAFAVDAEAATGGPGEVRWFVDANNVIVNSTSFASVPIPPGHTAVLKSVVDAACSCESRGRGLWDGTTYTLPASLKPQTTDAGQLKAAARRLYQRLIGLSESLEGFASYWPVAHVSLGHDLVAYAHRGVRGVVLSPSWTMAQKLAFMEMMARGALDVANPGEFFERIEEGDDFPDPAALADPRVLWVNPDTGLRVNLSQWFAEAVGAGNPTVLSRLAAETPNIADYIGGAWINSIVQ